jgi:hypothetical protein
VSDEKGNNAAEIKKLKLNSMVSVRELTIPTERNAAEINYKNKYINK